MVTHRVLRVAAPGTDRTAHAEYPATDNPLRSTSSQCGRPWSGSDRTCQRSVRRLVQRRRPRTPRACVRRRSGPVADAMIPGVLAAAGDSLRNAGFDGGVPGARKRLYVRFLSAPSRTRTDTWRILSPLPLPIGLWGRPGQRTESYGCTGIPSVPRGGGASAVGGCRRARSGDRRRWRLFRARVGRRPRELDRSRRAGVNVRRSARRVGRQRRGGTGIRARSVAMWISPVKYFAASARCSSRSR